jgi:hypothetical protein
VLEVQEVTARMGHVLVQPVSIIVQPLVARETHEAHAAPGQDGAEHVQIADQDGSARALADFGTPPFPGAPRCSRNVCVHMVL